MDEQDLLKTRRFRVVRRRYHTSDGKPHEREIVIHPGAVTILPLIDDDHVCLIRNRRLAVDQTLIELPAGTLEEGENPLDTARRELQEETGWAAERLEHLHSFWMSPGILRERMHLYLATGLSQRGPRLDAGEQIEPLIVTWQEAWELIESGEIEDAKTLVGLLYYRQLRKRAQ